MASSIRQDEFIEIVNIGDTTVHLGQGTLQDAVAERHRFTQDTKLAPNEVLLVFGGGTPTFDGTVDAPHCAPLPDNVTVHVANTGFLALNDTGERIELLGPAGWMLESVELGGPTTPGASYNRSLSFHALQDSHDALPGANGLISPSPTLNGDPIGEADHDHNHHHNHHHDRWDATRRGRPRHQRSPLRSARRRKL